MFEYVSGAVAPVENEFSWTLAGYDLAAGIVVGLLGWGLYRVWHDAARFTGRNAENAGEPQRSCCGSFRLSWLALGYRLGTVSGGVLPCGGAGSHCAAFRTLWNLLDRSRRDSRGDCARLVARSAGCGGTNRGRCITAVAAGWLLLWSFQAKFFDFLQETGGQSHPTFRTAATEPKQAAFDYIVVHSDPAHDIRVLTGEWWNFWPLAYLSQNVQAPHDSDDWRSVRSESATRRIMVEGYYGRKEIAIPV